MTLIDAPVLEMQELLSLYLKMGGQYEVSSGKLIADSRFPAVSGGRSENRCYPGFPTDLQSPLLAVCSTVQGKSRIEETIFEDRYKAAEQMKHMGADIQIKDSVAEIYGGNLSGTLVCAEDLRGGQRWS